MRQVGNFSFLLLKGMFFFRSGDTWAILNEAGKIPWERDIFTIAVIGVIKTSMQDFSKGVGIGSRSHDLFGESMMSRRISFSDAGQKLLILGTSGLVCSRLAGFGETGNLDRMSVILLRKNDPKVSASSASELHSGSLMGGQRWSIWLKAFHRLR